MNRFAKKIKKDKKRKKEKPEYLCLCLSFSRSQSRGMMNRHETPGAKGWQANHTPGDIRARSKGKRYKAPSEDMDLPSRVPKEYPLKRF